MGCARSHEFMEYVSVIMNSICENERLVRLLTPETEEVPKNPKQYLPYKYLLPYELVTKTLTERARFLGFEISASYDDRQKVYKDMTIDFFVISHQDLIKYPDPDMPGYNRRWYDLVVCELDDMFCGDGENSFKSGDLGIGKITMKSNQPYFVSYAREIPYKGRTISFKLDEWCNGKKYGK